MLMAKLLLLAPRHFIELPDRPWIEHGLKSLFPRVLGVSPESRTAGPVSTAAFRRTLEVNAAAEPPPSSMALSKQQTSQQASIAFPPQRLTKADIGAALLAAPTSLIAAHVQLRDAMSAAEGMLQDSRTVAQ